MCEVSSAAHGLLKDLVELQLLDLLVAILVNCFDKLITLSLSDRLLVAMS